MRPMFRMLILVLLVSFFSAAAAAIMVYVSLAVPVGPWIDPTIALICCAIVIGVRAVFNIDMSSDMTIVAAAAGVGGIVGNALAWSIPTLLFVRQEEFAQWVSDPMVFIPQIAWLVMAAGFLGYAVACFVYPALSHGKGGGLFPVGRLVGRTVHAPDELSQVGFLTAGSIVAVCYHIVCKRIVPGIHTLLIAGARTFFWWRIPSIGLHLDFVPMLWSIGCITGGVIAIPFAVGAGLKYLILEPFFRANIFDVGGDQYALLGCGSGIVLYGLLHGIGHLVFSFVRCIRGACVGVSGGFFAAVAQHEKMRYEVSHWIIGGLALAGAAFWSWYWLGSAWLSVVYILGATMVCAYQLIIFMARVGLAPLGRFATFVMVPGMLIFNFSPFQATLIAAFVEIAGGVAAVVASGSAALGVMAVRRDISMLRGFQLIALLVTACVASGVLWILIAKVGLGAASGLIVQRAQTRALVMQIAKVPVGSVFLGLIVALFLQLIGVNSTLALGGMLMSLDWSCILILSGLFSRYAGKFERLQPFWAGLFAMSSLWVVVRALYL